MFANTPDSDPGDELEALLRQLRAQSAPEPRPFFSARVRARLDTLEAPRPAPAASLPWLLRRPAYALLLGLLVLGLNVGAALRYVWQRPAASGVTATRYDAFVTEYQLDPFTVPLPRE